MFKMDLHVFHHRGIPPAYCLCENARRRKKTEKSVKHLIYMKVLSIFPCSSPTYIFMLLAAFTIPLSIYFCSVTLIKRLSVHRMGPMANLHTCLMLSDRTARSHKFETRNENSRPYKAVIPIGQT